jgi:uncharacterized glyoxalase superfamily protein PhnB
MQKLKNKPAKKLAAKKAPAKITKPAAKIAAKAPKAAAKIQAIPAGYHTITPGIIVKGAAEAIATFKKALGATEIFQMACQESGKIMHAELKIGDSVLSICEEMQGCTAATSSSFYLYVNNADASYAKAIAGGMTAKYPVSDMFWGDRVGKVTDSYGNTWSFATHTHDYTPEQIAAGQKKFAAEMKAKMGLSSGSCSSSESSCS